MHHCINLPFVSTQKIVYRTRFKTKYSHFFKCDWALDNVLAPSAMWKSPRECERANAITQNVLILWSYPDIITIKFIHRLNKMSWQIYSHTALIRLFYVKRIYVYLSCFSKIGRTTLKKSDIVLSSFPASMGSSCSMSSISKMCRFRLLLLYPLVVQLSIEKFNILLDILFKYCF